MRKENKITTHLWFDKEAKEAAQYYNSVFKDSRILNVTSIDNTPSGSVDIVTLDIMGHEFTLISAGPYFKINPSVSFMIKCKTKEEVGYLWGKLSPGNKVFMELDSYPFSERYGWIEDRFGLSWQIMYSGNLSTDQKIIPTLMFTEDVVGKCEEAVKFYTSVFHDSKKGDMMRYGKGEDPDKEGLIKHASFFLEGQEFAAMDSARIHDFTFNEAISFVMNCETQKEIDYYWEKLSSVPEAEQCGWLKDKFGFSWQIVPDVLNDMLSDKDPVKSARVTEAFLKMKKFDIAELKKSYEG